MSIITAISEFSDIFKWETNTPAKGGSVSGPLDSPTDGQMTAPIQSLANRTEYLYQRMLPLGTILMYGGVTAPTYFLVCDGSAVSRTTYATLFAAIGTRYGIGDGSTTFNLPDNRGLFPRGYSGTSTNDPDKATRTAVNGGSSGNNVGSIQSDELKAHNHDVDGSQSGGLQTDVVASALSDGSVNASVNSTGGNETRPKNIYHQFIIKAL